MFATLFYHKDDLPHGLRFRLYRSRGKNSAALEPPSGQKCYPCVRSGQSLEWCREGDLFSCAALNTRELYTTQRPQTSRSARRTRISHTFSHTGPAHFIETDPARRGHFSDRPDAPKKTDCHGSAACGGSLIMKVNPLLGRLKSACTRNGGCASCLSPPFCSRPGFHPGKRRPSHSGMPTTRNNCLPIPLGSNNRTRTLSSSSMRTKGCEHIKDQHRQVDALRPAVRPRGIRADSVAAAGLKLPTDNTS
jgi:hypothetical protein